MKKNDSMNKSKKSFFYRNASRLILIAVFVIAAALSLLISANSFFGLDALKLKELFGIHEFSHSADDYPLSVHFIDVGDGDSILISCEGKYALIDTGSQSLDGTVKKHLQHYGTDHIDLFVATHTDADHIGDFRSVAESFSISEAFVSSQNPDEKDKTPAEESLFSEIKTHNIKLTVPTPQKYDLGGAVLEVISPQKSYSESNDNSIVIRMTYKNVSFLFTGDAGIKAEKDLISSGTDIQCNVLKVSHHGSKTATSQEFLDAVSPTYAVVSVGGANKSLPDRDVISRIEACGADLFRTDLNGSVIIASDGTTIRAFTESGV